jgi:hypothetical protein
MKINEELKKSDVDKVIKLYIDSPEFKGKIEKIVKDRIKNEKALEDKVLEISKNVLTQLYKTLWLKKAFWLSNIKNSKN